MTAPLPTEHPTVKGLRLRVHVAKCIDTYHRHYSEACSPGGSGQCDGYCYDHNAECVCMCHTTWDLPTTTASVRDLHDEQNDVVRDGDTVYQWGV